MISSMAMMEHRDVTVAAPALVSDRAMLNFAAAITQYATSIGTADDVQEPLRALRARIENLQGLASLVRFATAGHPLSLGRVADELECLAQDFPQTPLPEHCVCEPCADWPGDRVLLASAVDLFVGATFASKDRPEQRDRLVLAAVRAIEGTIAFPVTFAPEAATLIGQGDGSLTMMHSRLVIANALQRLLEGDAACIPPLPRVVRQRLECLAIEWMRENPVDAMFAAVAGPKVERIVLWESPDSKSCVARWGDSVTLLVADSDDCCKTLDGYGPLFAPLVPGTDAFEVDSGMQVRVPQGARTGPVPLVKIKPDFTGVQAILSRYSDCFPLEWAASVFSTQRMDTWALADGFGPPILRIAPSPSPKSTGPAPGTKQPGMAQPPAQPPGTQLPAAPQPGTPPATQQPAMQQPGTPQPTAQPPKAVR